MRFLREPFWCSLKALWVRSFIYAILPFIALLVASNIYAVQDVRKQVSKSNHILAQMHVDLIESELYSISTNLSGFVMTNPDAAILSTDISGLSRHLAMVRLFNNLSDKAVGYSSSGNFFLYDTVQNTFAAVKTGYLSDGTFRPAYSYLTTMLRNDPSAVIPMRQWRLFAAGGNQYVLRMYQNGNCVVGAWLHVDTLMSKLLINHYNQQIVSLIATEESVPLTEVALVTNHHISLADSGNSYSISGNNPSYLIVREPFSVGPFLLYTLMPDQTIFERTPWILGYTVSIVLLLIGLIPYLFALLNKTLFLPLQDIIVAMNRMKSGDLGVRIVSRTRFVEFRRINDTFNEMVERIKTLKIDIYEQQLFSHKTELDYLRLQINPHFYLNSLNMIYGFCETKNYRLIREMTLSLVEYFRYLNQNDFRLTPLRDELLHIRNYLHIQEMRFPDQFAYKIDCPDSLCGYTIPTLLLQTFLENAIKYGANEGRLALHVRVALTESDDSPRLRIWIEDNGQGFPDKILTIIRNTQPVLKEDGQHIGIWNAMRRIRLLYGESGWIEFSNESGARIQINIPAECGEGDANVSDSNRR